MTAGRASPFQNDRDRTIPMRSAQQWTSCLICWTSNNRKQPFSATAWLLLSCRPIDGSQKCGVAVHSWVLVKWRSKIHTSLLARRFVLEIQRYENATQNTQSRPREEH